MTERDVQSTPNLTRKLKSTAQPRWRFPSHWRGKVTSVDKANVMESGVLWRERVSAVRAADWPHITLDHLYADACLFELVRNPKRFDVILADNLFGDLLSDCAASIAGSLGMLPSASIGSANQDGRRAALYEPVHGSAPDIVGMGIANPMAAILSVAMMLDLSFGRPDLAAIIERAVESVVTCSNVTADLGGTASTEDVTNQIIEIILATKPIPKG